VSEKLPKQPAAALPRRVDGIVTRTLGAKLILYNPESREVSVLNASAAAVWELCDGETPVAVAVGRLQSRFRIATPRDLQADVTAVLRMLAQRGLGQMPERGRLEEPLG